MYKLVVTPLAGNLSQIPTKFPNIIGSFNPTLSEHGLSLLISVLKTNHKKLNIRNINKAARVSNILLDVSGLNKTILHNYPILGRSWKEIDQIVLSHSHYDHVGALDEVLEKIWEAEGYKRNVPVYIHPYGLCERFHKSGSQIKFKDFLGKPRDTLLPFLKEKIVRKLPDFKPRHKECLILEKKSVILFENDHVSIQTTGEINIPDPLKKHKQDFKSLKNNNGILDEDKELDDQSIIITMKKRKKTVLLLGCCHAGLVPTIIHSERMTNLPIHSIIGGMHLIRTKEDDIKTICKQLIQRKQLKYLYPMHCTGSNFFHHIKNQCEKLGLEYPKCFNDLPNLSNICFDL
ncbi:metallo-beta-lactamase superfamily protein [Anaeramoeba flamelloides]|uniref:Metallo-beta-lactamase superfamily protein n=1 Tax=Anaeramoeba flamelloides TaxID=1746091 RepID=A0AAV8A7G3_9EUKA|nr:metallo-beta-lactamase superfamily protein [Anaeramoeba flamelloides]